MSMRSRYLTSYTTLKTEGAILPRDIIQRIADYDKSLGGLTPESYHLGKTEKINEATNRAWNRLVGAWAGFRQTREKLSETDIGTRVTREQWLLPLFQELGYGRLLTTKAIEFEDRQYPISHIWQHAPIHLVGCKVDLDKRTAGVAGAAKISPHSLVQELLNRADEYLWGFVSNGLTLRILRDNRSLTRQAYIEFDLEVMMEGEAYSDFVLLWSLCHQSRVEADKPEECWLEKWSKAARDQGIRALEHLRDSVQNAISIFGAGFLSHPRNAELRRRLQEPGGLDKQDYYRQLLRLVYRLLFLLVAEDRELLLDPNATPEAKELYNGNYSVSRLRAMAEKIRGTRHSDLYEVLKLVMGKLGKKEGCPELGLPGLGSDLFSETALPDLEAADLSNSDLLEAIRTLTMTVEGRIRRTVDYKNLRAEELGSVYESLLEMHPDLNADAGRFELRVAAGHERKTTGSYYTPESLVQCLLDSALDPVLTEAASKPNPEEAILKLKVCDPACGSGHFLIAAAHRIAKRLAAVRTGDDEPSPEFTRKALRDVIGRCIYGVDLNPDAVELCKVALWIEALEPGKPLSFLKHHIQCGNSLLGSTPALIKKGIPDEAFTPIEGDDKEICKDYKKRNKKERETQQESLLTAALKPWDTLGNMAAVVANLDDIEDDTPEGIERKRVEYEKVVKSSGYLYNRFWADTWCAAFVWKKNKDLPYPITEEVFRRIERTPHSVDEWLREEVVRLRDQYKFFHWHLAYPDVFTLPSNGKKADNEQTGWNGGFDVVLGNPPWERVKLQEKEYFARINPDIAKAGTAAKRRQMIAALKGSDSEIFKTFLNERRLSESASLFLRESCRYPYSAQGDINYYVVFTELTRTIIRSVGARVGLITPSGIATDDSTKDFFTSLIDQSQLVSLYGFENERNLFSGLMHNFRFALVTLSSTTITNRLPEFAFSLWDVSDLNQDERRFTLDQSELSLLNPNTRNCPLFKGKKDADIVKAIYGIVPVLLRERPLSNPWNVKYNRMVDMTNDSHMFRSVTEIESGQLDVMSLGQSASPYLPLYEAKMIYFFDHRYASAIPSRTGGVRGSSEYTSNLQHRQVQYVVQPRFWVDRVHVQHHLDEKRWLIGFRGITGAVVNVRTVIFAFLPPVAVGNTMPLIDLVGCTAKKAACFVANLNSMILDYVARQKLGGTALNFFILNQLPVLTPVEYQSYTVNGVPLIEWISEIVLRLTYNSTDMTPFARDMGYLGDPFEWDEESRTLQMRQLDAVYAMLYGLSRDKLGHVLDHFRSLERVEQAELGEYRTKRQVLEAYDQLRPLFLRNAK